LFLVYKCVDFSSKSVSYLTNRSTGDTVDSLRLKTVDNLSNNSGVANISGTSPSSLLCDESVQKVLLTVDFSTISAILLIKFSGNQSLKASALVRPRRLASAG